MGNIFRFLLVLPCITLLLYSCESEIENEIQSFQTIHNFLIEGYPIPIMISSVFL